MGGNATFSGTTYQARVIAFVLAHVLTESKLRWLTIEDDTPVAVSGEVSGPGDDAQIEFRAGGSPIEIQTKHGLKPKKCVEAFVTIRDRSLSDDHRTIVLIVDGSSSSEIRNDLKRDLGRLRSGRSDALKGLTDGITSALGERAHEVMRRVHVLSLDVEEQSDPGATRALELLSDNLEDPSKAHAAWAILEKEAATMCAERSRRDRKALITTLNAAGLGLLPPKTSRRWHDDLRHSRKLLAEDEPETVLAFLRGLETEYRKSETRDPEILYKLSQHRASALLQLGELHDAIDAANTALDHKPTGEHALVTLANAQAMTGDIAAATVTAQKATDLHPTSALAWAMRMQLSFQPDQRQIEVPSAVAATGEFRTHFVNVLLSVGDFARARQLAAELILQGDRSARVLLARAESLLADIEAAPGDRMARAQEADRLCTEVLDGGELSNRTSVRALVARSAARRILERIGDSEEDSERALAISRDDVNALAAAVQAKIEAGDEQSALDLLIGASLEEHPVLLALRATLFADRGELEKAKKDLDALLQVIPDSTQADKLRSAAAEAALHLDDVNLAKKLVADITTGSSSLAYLVTLARIAVLEGDFERAEDEYRRAIAVDPSAQADLLSELGSRFLKAKRPKDATRVFREAPRLPQAAERHFTRALVEAGALGEAHNLIEEIAARGPMPDWAVAFAAQIALRRNDPKEGAAHLEDLFARGPVPPDVRLTLIQTLVELEQHERALFHASELAVEPGLDARERMFLGQMFLALGEPTRALEIGLGSYRDASDDAEINRAFTGLLFFSKVKLPQFEQVGPGTYVRLNGPEGAKLEYLIFATPATSKLPREITVEDATKAGLLGLRKGEKYVLDKGTWFEKSWTVEEILPVEQFLANDILGHYGTRFPGADFFAVGFQFNTESPGLTDLQPMIASTHQHVRHQQEILDTYQEQCLPLAVIAKLAGVTVPSLMAELSKPDATRPIYVEWTGAPGRVGSRDAARQRGVTVLTRSAMVTLQDCKLLGRLGEGRRLIAPRALRDELKHELKEARQRVEEGWNVLLPSERGISFQNLEAGHPWLVKQQSEAEATLQWFDAHVEVLPRPLQAFEDEHFLSGGFRTRLGESSNDALELARHTPGALYADDLGLRRLAQALSTTSFATVSLIQVWAEEGLITPNEKARLLTDLSARHYFAVVPTPDILLEVLSPARTPQQMRDVFSLLGANYVPPQTAATLIVRTVKMNALRSLQVTTVEQIVNRGLSNMVPRTSPEVAARLVARAAEIDLALLPTEQRLVKLLCTRFAKNGIQSVG